MCVCVYVFVCVVACVDGVGLDKKNTMTYLNVNGYDVYNVCWFVHVLGLTLHTQPTNSATAVILAPESSPHNSHEVGSESIRNQVITLYSAWWLLIARVPKLDPGPPACMFWFLP